MPEVITACRRAALAGHCPEKEGWKPRTELRDIAPVLVGGGVNLEETEQNKAARRERRDDSERCAVVVVKSKSRFHRPDQTSNRHSRGKMKER